MFLTETEIASYADDNTPFSCQFDPTNITLNPEIASSNLLTWCVNNGMKANPDKYHFLHTENIYLTVKIDQIEIKGSEKENILRVLIDKRLTFEPHV